jgi:uncharacterized protein YndB with AHSA1/START domain
VADKSQVVTKTVSVPAGHLFAVLADPARHLDIDGSRSARGAVTTDRIGGVGGVFRIDMSRPGIGDYQMDNRVVEFEDGQRIAWAPGQAGGVPLGHVWRWELEPDSDSTRVTHTYDWSGVTDENILAVVPFPVISTDEMAASIDRLAALAS